jgi:hypothetical protein
MDKTTELVPKKRKRTTPYKNKRKTIEYACAVPGCKNKNKKNVGMKTTKRIRTAPISKAIELEYYLFPRTTKWCEKWLLAVNPDKPKNSPIDWRICGKHFKKSDFLLKPKKILKIKTSAIPSLELDKISNENPKLLSIGINRAVNLVISDINLMYPENITTEEKRVEEKSTKIVTPLIPKCGVPHCRLGIADGVKLFNLPKASSGAVRITNKKGNPEVMDIRAAWIKLAGILVEDSHSNTNVKICSQHFLPQQIMTKKTEKGM